MYELLVSTHCMYVCMDVCMSCLYQPTACVYAYMHVWAAFSNHDSLDIPTPHTTKNWHYKSSCFLCWCLHIHIETACMPWYHLNSACGTLVPCIVVYLCMYVCMHVYSLNMSLQMYVPLECISVRTSCHLGWRTLVLKCNKNNYDWLTVCTYSDALYTIT